MNTQRKRFVLPLIVLLLGVALAVGWFCALYLQSFLNGPYIIGFLVWASVILILLAIFSIDASIARERQAPEDPRRGFEVLPAEPPDAEKPDAP